MSGQKKEFKEGDSIPAGTTLKQFIKIQKEKRAAKGNK